MRILFFIESAEPGGAEQVVVTLAVGLRRRGHATLVATLTEGWLTAELRRQEQEFVRLESASRLDLGLARRLVSLIRTRRVDVLHSHLLDSTFYGALAARIAGVPHLATDHGDAHLPVPKRHATAKLRIASRLGTSFTAVSRFTAERLRERGVPGSRIRQLANPLGQVLPRSTEARERVFRELGLGDGGTPPWVWINAGMLRAVKDQRTLIRAFAAASRLATGKQVLLIAGEGPEREGLEALTRELGMEAHVALLGFREDLPRLLAAADGFVMTSLSEGLPMSLLEAAASGLYVVGSSVGGIPEIVEDGVTGRLFPAGDDRALSEILAGAVRDPEGAMRVAANGRDRVVSRYAAERVLDDYVEICTGLLSPGHGRHA